MATATIETIETEYDHCVALHGVDWKGYSTLLRLRGERSVPRIVYLWVCDGAGLVILVIQSNGWYAESPNSLAFPFLSAAEVYDWVRRPQTGSDTDWIKELRSWVKRTLKPRVRGQEKDGG